MKRKNTLKLVHSRGNSLSETLEHTSYRRQKAFENPLPTGEVTQYLSFANYAIANVCAEVLLECDCLQDSDEVNRRSNSSINGETLFHLQYGYALVLARKVSARSGRVIDPSDCYVLKWSLEYKEISSAFIMFEEVILHCRQLGYDNAKEVLRGGFQATGKNFSEVKGILASSDVREVLAPRVLKQCELLSFQSFVEVCISQGVHDRMKI